MRHHEIFSATSKKVNFLVLNDHLLNDASNISAECSFFLLNTGDFF